MIERSGLCQIKALNLLFSKNNATPILKAPTVFKIELKLYQNLNVHCFETKSTNINVWTPPTPPYIFYPPSPPKNWEGQSIDHPLK